MTLSRIKKIVDALSAISAKPFTFNDIKIEVTYVGRAKHSKVWVIGSHYHPWFEFNYVSKGSVYTTIAGKEFLVTDGQSYIVPPGVYHSHRNNKTGDDGICIRFSITPIDQYKTKNILDTLSVPRSYTFISNIEKLHLGSGSLSMQGFFIAWLSQLCEEWSDNENPSTNTQKNSLSHQVNLYLEKYYMTKIRVQDIANALNVSYRTLARSYKAETGYTILDMLTKIRLDQAKKLLKGERVSIYDIAIACGYENEFYFSKIFKENEGMSPSCYRKI